MQADRWLGPLRAWPPLESASCLQIAVLVRQEGRLTILVEKQIAGCEEYTHLAILYLMLHPSEQYPSSQGPYSSRNARRDSRHPLCHR